MMHISGADVDVLIGTKSVNIKQFTVNIEDGTKPTYTRGVANGHVRGQTSASGEITVDTENFNLIMESARDAGDFQSLSPFDIVGLGKTPDQELKVASFGCKLRISKLLDSNGDGGDKLEHTLPYDVTDPRFVEINDTPYLSQAHLDRLG